MATRMELPPGATRIDTVQDLYPFGLNLRMLGQVRGTLVYEEPVAVGVRITGTCRIGAYTYQGQGGMIRNTRIGRFCSIGGQLEIGHFQHPTEWATTHPMLYGGTRKFAFYEEYREIERREPWHTPRFHGLRVDIGNDVWIGDKVAIFNPIAIGDGAILAYGALVNKPVAPYEIWAGFPARHVSDRFREITAEEEEAASLRIALRESRWWDLCPKTMRQMKAPMTEPRAFLDWLETHRADLPPFRPRSWKVSRWNADVIVEPVEEPAAGTTGAA